MPDPAPCSECGAALVRTSAEYWCCPNGHGRLVPATSEPPSPFAELLRSPTDPLPGDIDRERRAWRRKLDAAFPRKGKE